MRRRKANDIVKYEREVINDIEGLKNISDITHIFYGEADYGYFVQVYSDSHHKEIESIGLSGFNTDTKAGARNLAKIYHEKLGIPLMSDWD